MSHPTPATPVSLLQTDKIGTGKVPSTPGHCLLYRHTHTCWHIKTVIHRYCLYICTYSLKWRVNRSIGDATHIHTIYMAFLNVTGIWWTFWNVLFLQSKQFVFELLLLLFRLYNYLHCGNKEQCCANDSLLMKNKQEAQSWGRDKGCAAGSSDVHMTFTSDLQSVFFQSHLMSLSHSPLGTVQCRVWSMA